MGNRFGGGGGTPLEDRTHLHAFRRQVGDDLVVPAGLDGRDGGVQVFLRIAILVHERTDAGVDDPLLGRGQILALEVFLDFLNKTVPVGAVGSGHPRGAGSGRTEKRGL